MNTDDRLDALEAGLAAAVERLERLEAQAKPAATLYDLAKAIDLRRLMEPNEGHSRGV